MRDRHATDTTETTNAAPEGTALAKSSPDKGFGVEAEDARGRNRTYNLAATTTPDSDDKSDPDGRSREDNAAEPPPQDTETPRADRNGSVIAPLSDDRLLALAEYAEGCAEILSGFRDKTAPDAWAGTAAALRELVQARAEVERLRADAARYRFLRDNPLGFRAVDGNASARVAHPDVVDRWVDAAMEATP